MKGIRLCIGLLLVTAIAMGQQRQVNRIKKELNKVVNSKEFSTAFVGFSLVDTETGKVLVEHNAEKSFTTASTMKLVTTGAALALLGDTFRFKTELGYYSGNINDGILDDLTFKSYGDPTFLSDRFTATDSIPFFYSVFVSLQKLGIKNINTVIKINQDIFRKDVVPPGYAFEDIAYSYGAPLFAFNYKDNTNESQIDTIIMPSIINSDTVILKNKGGYNIFLDFDNPLNISLLQKDKFADHTPAIRFLNELYSYNNNILQSSYPDLYLNLSIKDNCFSRECNKYFQKDNPSPILNTLDITQNGLLKKLHVIKTYYSPPLIEIATKTNESSINLYAEGILRALSTYSYGYSTLDTSLAIAQRFWKNEVGDLKGLRMTDGSGLSRSNLCSPALMTKMLSSYTNRPNFGSFYSTLAVAGKTGTVANFCKGTAAEGNARIKSGSMSRVKCYAGYVTGKDGKLYAFTLMFNNFESTAAPTAAAQKIIPLIAGLKHGKSKRYLIDLTPSRQ